MATSVTGAAELARNSDGGNNRCRHRSSHLTDREVEILCLTAVGSSNEVIARRLFVSRQTIAHSLSRIYLKLDVRSRAEAIARLYAFGILRPGSWPPVATGKRCSTCDETGRERR